MADYSLLVIITITFLLAGGVKGVIGLGLPTVSLGLLAATMDLPSAIGLMLIPSFVTNIWQALAGGNPKNILLRTWPFLLMATLMIGPAAVVLTAASSSLLGIFLAVLLIAYAALNWFGLKYSISRHNEKLSGTVFGTLNGIFTGMTGAFVVPGVFYLQAIGLPRDQLVQAMGLLFSLSTIALFVALKNNELLTVELSIISVFAVIPAVIGMMIGQRLRSKLSENVFRKTFFFAIFLLGLFIFSKSLFFIIQGLVR